MRNLEFKARCADLARAEEVAQSLGARLAGDLQQRDTYFNAPSGRLKLRESTRRFREGVDRKQGELIFYDRPENSATRWSDYFVAAVATDAVVDMRDVLTHALGVKQAIEKTRRLYLYPSKEGETRIHLDRVARLGTFVEFEVPTQSDETAARATMALLMNAFGFSDADSITASYSERTEQQS